MGRPAASSPAALARMKRQRRKHTEPELRVRRALTRLGVRYRLHASKLPGSPDLSNQASGWALFVHGCFWHHHEGCPRATVPKNNRLWWLAKLERNRERDRAKEAALRAQGLHVVVVWECETRDEATLQRRLAEYFERTANRQGEGQRANREPGSSGQHRAESDSGVDQSAE